MTRVMGIDPSLAATGVALPDGTLRTIKPGDTDGGHRLHLIAGGVRHLLAERLDGSERWTVPDVVVLERIPLHGKGTGGALARAELVGCIRRDLYALGIPMVEVDNSRLKRWATGNGNADRGVKGKPMVVAAARALGYDPADDDQADAAILRSIGLHAYGEADVLVGNPVRDKARLEVVAAIDWPVLPR